MEIIGNIFTTLLMFAFGWYAMRGVVEYVRKTRAQRRKLEAETRMADEIGRQMASGNATIHGRKHGE